MATPRSVFPDSASIKDALTYEAILPALFENYESIYAVDLESSNYRCYHESEPYRDLKIASRGKDFFAALSSFVPKVIHKEDRAYVLENLDPAFLIPVLEQKKYHAFVYRLILDGKPVYHKSRATLATVNGRRLILLGVRDVDETIRQERSHAEAIVSMQQKEKNHLEAILASAAGYMEVNLTKDLVLERSDHPRSGAPTAFLSGVPALERYSELNAWILKNRVTSEKEEAAKVSDRENLLKAFQLQNRRASVSFSVKKKNGADQPCREVFYLYRDEASGDVMAFCVIYDLTEQQLQEKERKDLEEELVLSRIRNSTSQMNPHFLYNVLGSIQEIVLENPEYASELIEDFTLHLRGCVRAMTSDSAIPFTQELTNIKAYVNIEKMRFGAKLKVVYDLPVTDFEILPLSVQPLVENAIRHGIYERGARGGTVTIRTEETENGIVVQVIDDGVGFDPQTVERGVRSGKKDSSGLKNITFRLEKVMNAKVSIESKPGAGTTVTICIPKKGGNREGDCG